MSELDKAIEELESELIQEGVAADAPKKGAAPAEKMEKGGDYEDLGEPVVDPEQKKGPDSTKKIKKDSTVSSKVALKAEAKKVSEEDEDEDDKEEDEEEMSEGYMNKEAMINAMYEKMKSYKRLDLQAAYEAMMNDDDEEDEEEIEESFEERLSSIDVSEDVSSLIDGEELTEDFKEKTHTIFEAAIKSKLRGEVARLEEEKEIAIEEEVESVKSELTEKVDSYLSYAINEWMEENKLAIERGLKSELAEDFISGLKGLFEEHYIDVPNEKYDVMEEQSEKIDELENKLNESFEKNIELSKSVSKLVREKIIKESAEGLTDTESDKFFSLAEEIEFIDEESFVEKLDTIKESYFQKSVKNLESIDSGKLNESFEVEGSMGKYMQAISKVKK